MVSCALCNTRLYILAFPRAYSQQKRIDLAFWHSSVLNSPWCPELMFRYGISFTNAFKSDQMLVSLSSVWEKWKKNLSLGKDVNLLPPTYFSDALPLSWVVKYDLLSKGHTCICMYM